MDDTARIVTWNLLSSKLCDKTRYPVNKDEDLAFENRILVIKRSLLEVMCSSSILLLQEVCHAMLGELIPFLELNDYAHISASYGNPGSGFFGVLVAWPRESYRLTRMKVGNATNEKKWLSQDSLSPKTADEQVWFEASQKKNQYIFAEFDGTFVVGTYHMPCNFQNTKIMTIYASNIAELAFDFAAGLPLILGGDFNIKPHDFQYEMLTGDVVDFVHDAIPAPLPGDLYRVGRFPPLHSAYKTVCGKEPRFTNHVIYMDSDTKERCPFADTLDYIFYSGAIRPVSVKILPDINPSDIPPFPTDVQPSDHLMLCAEFDAEATTPNASPIYTSSS
jgi:exonuclease III